MQAPSTNWEICTTKEVFCKTTLGLMFGGQSLQLKDIKAQEPIEIAWLNNSPLNNSHEDKTWLQVVLNLIIRIVSEQTTNNNNPFLLFCCC